MFIMSAYCTQYMEAYRSPHESPTGCGGASISMVLLKEENKKLRDDNVTMARETTRLRQQLSYIKSAVNTPYKKSRPSKLDLSKIDKNF